MPVGRLKVQGCGVLGDGTSQIGVEVEEPQAVEKRADISGLESEGLRIWTRVAEAAKHLPVTMAHSMSPYKHTPRFVWCR